MTSSSGHQDLPRITIKLSKYNSIYFYRTAFGTALRSLGQNRQRYVVAKRVVPVCFDLCGYFVMISGPIIKVGNHVEIAGLQALHS